MKASRGFTLIELLVVLAVLALMVAVAYPRYAEHVDRAKEAALRHNLLGVRDAIDKFHADRARYPKDLPELVEQRYLRALPVDPITERNDSWRLVPASASAGSAGIVDLHSGATGRARTGEPYASW